MAKKKKQKHQSGTDLPIIVDYGSGLMSVYDPIAMLPYSEPSIAERTRFKKLSKEQRAAFKALAVSAATDYWEAERQIPFGEDMADIRKWLVETFAEDYGILLKEDTELKNYLQNIIIPTLNKLLKAEKARTGKE